MLYCTITEELMLAFWKFFKRKEVAAHPVSEATLLTVIRREDLPILVLLTSLTQPSVPQR